MLPFPENKKRKRQALTVEQKKWICERKKTEPAITHKNIEGKMAAIDTEDEDETLELVALDDEP